MTQEETRWHEPGRRGSGSEPAWSDERVAAWRAVLLAQSRVVRAIEADLDAAGLVPLTWYDVLLELNGADGGGLRMAELASRVVLSRTRVSRLVGELEGEGLVVRVPDPDDGRASRATITDAGRTALRTAAPVYLAGIDRHFARHLDEGERRVVAAALERVVNRLPGPERER